MTCGSPRRLWLTARAAIAASRLGLPEHANGQDSPAMPSSATQATLERAISPVARCLTTECAQALLAAPADPQTQAGLDELAEKANGELTPAEVEENDALILLGDLVAILQARARVVLADRA